MTPLHLRPARSTDAGQIGEILWQFDRGRLFGDALFSSAEAIAICGTMIDRGWVTVARDDDRRICGFVARDGEEVHALYVARDRLGQGVGRQLLDDAKTRCDRLVLNTASGNNGARRFYRREGFAEARSTGAELCFVWTSKEAGA